MAIDQNEHLEIQGQVRRIQASKRFANAPKAKTLLTYIVEKALGGLDGDLKEIMIARALYGKGSNFDPGTDRIVSTAAGDLRKKLIEYYADEGRHDPLVIAIPIGGFVPEFTARTEHSTGSIARRREGRREAGVGTESVGRRSGGGGSGGVGAVRATLRLRGAGHESRRRRDGRPCAGRHRKGLGAEAEQLPDRGACRSVRPAVGPGPNRVARVDAERALRAG